MKDFCVKDIVRAVGGSLLCGDENVQIDNFATNSGKAEPGLALVGVVVLFDRIGSGLKALFDPSSAQL